MLLSERWGSTDTSRHLLGKLMAAVARPCLAICWNPLRSSEMGASLWLGQAALVVDMPSCTDGSKSSTWQTQHSSNISRYTNQTHGSWCSPLACRIELEPTTITFRRRMVDFWPHVNARGKWSRGMILTLPFGNNSISKYFISNYHANLEGICIWMLMWWLEAHSLVYDDIPSLLYQFIRDSEMEKRG